MRIDPRTLSREQLELARWKPKDAITVRPKGVDGVAYVYPRLRGGVTVLCYAGRAVKHCAHYSFRTHEQAAAWLSKWAAGLQSNDQARADRVAAQKAFRHELQVGDVLKSSWGYDQTNVDYYQVTKRSTACVWIRPIASQSQETASMQGDCVPSPGRFTGAETRHRVTTEGSVRIASYAYASKIEAIEVGGVKVFPTSHWTAYA